MTSNAPTRPSHLEPSPLGTKEYWDSLYTTELTNHASDTSNVGTIWFSDSSAEDKVLTFLSKKILTDQILGPSITRHNCSFLDLGTGNGHFLLRMRGVADEFGDCLEEEETWGGRLLGVDYSERSVEFARRVAEDKGVDVEFLWWDIMSQDPSTHGVLEGAQKGGWDVVLDKGTFDAISLSEVVDAEGRRLCEGYKERVLALVREGGLLVLTSCNWTVAELRAWFEGQGFVWVEEVRYRSFVFGGREGQAISSVCFRKEALS